MTKKEDILEYAKSDPPTLGDETYYRRVAEKFGTSSDYVRNVCRGAGLSNIRATSVSERTFTSLEDAIYYYLKKGEKKATIEELSDHFDAGVSRVRDSLEALRNRGVNIQIDESQLVEVSKTLPIKNKATVIHLPGKEHIKTYKFGLTADNHLCSTYERLDILEALFDIWERNGVTTVLQGGNMIDGEARFNKFDIHTRGIDGQVGYFVEKWPRRNGIVTKFVTGDDHEGWYMQREGIDIGRKIELEARAAGREDIIHLGYMEHDFIFPAKEGETVVKLAHAGGGSSYAVSYSVQKIVESYQGGEKPDILLAGHFHKAEYSYYRGFHCIQMGCTEDQTPFMRKKRIQAHLGGWTLEFDQDTTTGAVIDVRLQFHPFFNREYYDRDKRWSYKQG